MSVIPTSGLRKLWAPGCEDAHGDEIVAMWSAIDDVMIHHGYVPRPGYTSAANCRAITGGKLLSIHSFYDRRRRYTFRSSAPGHPVTIPVAAAVDINSDKNPYGPRLVTDMPEAMWRDWLRVRCNNGAQLLVWGGLFTPNHDAMHIQPGCGPADIRTGIDRSTLPDPTPTPAPEPMEDDDAMLIYTLEPGAGDDGGMSFAVQGNRRRHLGPDEYQAMRADGVPERKGVDAPHWQVVLDTTDLAKPNSGHPGT